MDLEGLIAGKTGSHNGLVDADRVGAGVCCGSGLVYAGPVGAGLASDEAGSLIALPSSAYGFVYPPQYRSCAFSSTAYHYAPPESPGR